MEDRCGVEDHSGITAGDYIRPTSLADTSHRWGCVHRHRDALLPKKGLAPAQKAGAVSLRHFGEDLGDIPEWKQSNLHDFRDTQGGEDARAQVF